MPEIVTTHQTHRDFRVHTVATADSIAGPWQNEPHLYCDRLSLKAGEIDEAVLSYHFGELIQPGQTAFAVHSVRNLRRKFVRVTIDQGPGNAEFVWYGFITAEQQDRSGAHLRTRRRLAGDVQLFAAVGLEWFLDRVQVSESRLANGQLVKRAIPFNDAAGQVRESSQVRRGNRHPFLNAFADTLDTAVLWTGGNIVRYLLFNQRPETNSGFPWPVNYQLDVNAPLEWFTPTLDPAGRTLLAIVNEIIAARRGLSWRLVVNAASQLATIVVFSFSLTNFVLPSGSGVFPQNANVVTLDFDRALDIEVASLRWVEDRRYDRVRARGARRGACFTVSPFDGTLEADWNIFLQPEYRDAAKNTAGYSSLSAEKKEIRNDEFRRAEKYCRLWRCFRIPPTWDGRAGAGDGGFRDFVFPQLDQNGLIMQAGEPFWHAGLRLANHTPLATDLDYSTQPPASGTPAGSLPELRPPLVLMEIAPGIYQYADQLDTKGVDGADGKLTASYYLRMQETSLGFELRPGGGCAHLLADNTNDWPEGGSFPPEPTQYEPEVDWRKMRATVFCECDTHVEEVYPQGPIGAADFRALEELVIDVGERARLDYLAPRTIFDVSNGIPRQASSGGQFLRDDRGLLRDIARIAFVWYDEPRAAFSLSYRQLTALFTIGDFVASIGMEETFQLVNTVVTNIDYDLVAGVTTVRTDFADLDFTEFLPL